LTRTVAALPRAALHSLFSRLLLSKDGVKDSLTLQSSTADHSASDYIKLNTNFRTHAKNFEKNLYKLMNNVFDTTWYLIKPWRTFIITSTTFDALGWEIWYRGNDRKVAAFFWKL